LTVYRQCGYSRALGSCRERSHGQPAIWIPLGTRDALAAQRDSGLVYSRATAVFRTVARLAPTVRPRDVARLTTTTAARLAQLRPSRDARLTIGAAPLTGMRASGDRTELIAAIVLVAALIVVITCTNVSALLLGRAAARRREIAVRLALGATRARLIRQMLTESLVLAILGAAVALVLYIVVIRTAYATMPDIIYGLSPRLPTFLSAGAVALATTMVFGVAPALHATNADIGEAMKNAGSGAIRRSRIQMLFVVAQLACRHPVLVVTSLVLANLRAGAHDNAARAPDSVITMSATVIRPHRGDSVSDSKSDADVGTLAAIRERLARIPAVQSVGVSTEGVEHTAIVRLGNPGEFATQNGGSSNVRLLYVSNGYFAAHEFPVTRGRALSAEEDRAGSLAVVINEAAAAMMWPGENPIGKRLARQSDDGRQSAPLEVIGVVGPAPYEGPEPVPMIYAPLSTASDGLESEIAVRTAGDARARLPQIRAAIRDVEPHAALRDIATLAERYESQRRQAVESNAAALAIGVVALLLVRS
jgi:putative ABC transport system permease protein